ncbi:hypothetical protein K504DRAFT_506621 [Pleomassaria siparia CBS 279.74]|uniref:F-box domain-containing protein n=1 Tax=Pleomassaria siparia CBS 279.74 TaxID=1314801 RepID=A0A6G1JWJ4_9PLEO|nr:hypothetical protein K504DRAFT_506621 [Pleomassaria siparia CBS 279.74]
MGLANLPTELVEHITAYLDLTTFRSFRLVSHSLGHQALHQFKERFFRKRSISWTLSSFQTVSAINAHHYFGNALQHLFIDATPRHAIKLWKLKSDISASMDIASEGEYETEKKESDRISKMWNATRFDQKTLIKMFEEIAGGMLESITFAYSGMEKKYGKFARRYCETSQNEMSRPFVSVMSAIVASRITVKRIWHDPKKGYGAVSIGRLEALSPTLSHFDAAFEKLQALSLNLRDWRHPEEGFEPLIGKTPFVVRFLAKCRNIRSLELSCYSTLEDDMFAELATHCVFPRLESCELGLFRIYTIASLLSLVASTTTLKTLSLTRIVLRSNTEAWPALIHALADNVPSLEYLKLTKNYEGGGQVIRFEIPHPYLEGKTLLTNSLDIRGNDAHGEMRKHAENVVTSSEGPACLSL